MKLTLGSLVACVAVSAIGVSSVVAQPAVPEQSAPQSQPLAADEEQGSTVPNSERDLSFNLPGLVSKVNVKNGDVVKEGQLLAQQDTDVEEAALAREEYLFKSNVQEKAAVAQRDLAAVELKRQETLRKNNANSPTEYERAKVELIIANLKIDLAKEETESKRLDIVKLKKQIARMQMKSPINGEVRQIETQVGEVSDPQKPSITVVSNDPLWVETKIPTQIANQLKSGQSLQVRYRDEGTDKWREAKIIYFDPVADVTLPGGAQLIRLEMPNPENRRAGQEVVVKLPQGMASAK